MNSPTMKLSGSLIIDSNSINHQNADQNLVRNLTSWFSQVLPSQRSFNNLSNESLKFYQRQSQLFHNLLEIGLKMQSHLGYFLQVELNNPKPSQIIQTNQTLIKQILLYFRLIHTQDGNLEQLLQQAKINFENIKRQKLINLHQQYANDLSQFPKIPQILTLSKATKSKYNSSLKSISIIQSPNQSIPKPSDKPKKYLTHPKSQQLIQKINSRINQEIQKNHQNIAKFKTKYYTNTKSLSTIQPTTTNNQKFSSKYIIKNPIILQQQSISDFEEQRSSKNQNQNEKQKKNIDESEYDFSQIEIQQIVQGNKIY